MRKSIFLIFIFIFSIFSTSFGLEKKSNLKGTQIIYKEKPKKKKSDKKKLDRKKKKYWEKSNKNFHRFSRSSKYSDLNPANLAIKSPFYFFRFDLPSVNLQFTNESISPQFLIDYFTTGEKLSSNSQNEVISSFQNLQLYTNLNVKPIRLEFGKYRFSSNLTTLINGNLSGDILAIPFSNFNMGMDYDQKFIIEVLSYVKNSIGYGQTYKTDFATFRAGLNYNYFLGLAYVKTSADTFNLINNLENVGTNINLSFEGSQLIWDSMSEEGLQTNEIGSEHFSETSNGFDIGIGANLKKLIHQNLDIELYIENIGASLTFKDMKKKSYSNKIFGDNIIDFSDSLNALGNEMDTVSTMSDVTIDLPQKTMIKVTYQPIPSIVVSGGFEKYSESFITYNSKPNIHLKAGFYPRSWLGLSYGISTRNSQVIQTIGTGMQTKRFDLLLDVSSYDGILNSANGLGVAIRFSFYL